MPQLRQNIITGEWVVIAPERAKRPQDFVIPKSVKVADKSKCPFCIGSEGYKANEKVPHEETENIYVLENRYPAFVENEKKSSIRSFYPEKGFYRARPSIGDHEVIVIKDHDKSFLTLEPKVMEELIGVIKNRYVYMKEKEKLISIVPIYNHGAEAGASIEHPHAQIFASGVISNTVGKEMDGAEKYYDINGACVFCDLIKHELQEKVRLVAENEYFVSATFFAARFPFETWIYPKFHESQFEVLTKNQQESYANILCETLKKLNLTLENPPLNMYIHTLPAISEDSASYHWHTEITPRVTNFGGFELGSDIVIDIMSPEEAADYLRSSKKGEIHGREKN